MKRAPITTHILNLQSGRPASGVGVELLSPAGETMGQSRTDNDGRILLWSDDITLTEGVWTLVFATQRWFEEHSTPCFFADVRLSFMVDNIREHYHVPLLLNAFGYSTYRGS